MKLILRFIDWVLYTSLFTACCATGLCMATEQLIISAHPPFAGRLHILVFCSTLVVYNMPRIVRKPRENSWQLRYRKWHFFLFLISIAFTAVVLSRMSLTMVSAASMLGLLALAYFLPLLPFKDKKRLRDFGWLKISVLTGVWTLATAVLPMIYWHINIADFPFEVLSRLFFIFTLCIIFDIRDIRTDHNNNINTLPHKMGIRNAILLINCTLLLFFACGIIQYIRLPHLERLVSTLITAIATRAVVAYLVRHPSDRAYNLLADGVMLLYAALILLH